MTIDAATPAKMATLFDDVLATLEELRAIAVNQTLRHTEHATVAAIGHVETAGLWAVEALRIYLTNGD